MTCLLQYRPPRIAIALMALFGVVAHFSPPGTLLHLPYRVLGTAAGLSGLSIMMWAWLLFRQADTAVCPTGDNSVLVTKGPFHLTRNPMYLGMLGTLLGIASLMENPVAYLAPLSFFLIIDKVFIPYEEEKMVRTFGVDYEKFTRRTRRWL